MTATHTVDDYIGPNWTFIDHTEPYISLYNPTSPQVTLNLRIRLLMANRIFVTFQKV